MKALCLQTEFGLKKEEVTFTQAEIETGQELIVEVHFRLLAIYLEKAEMIAEQTLVGKRSKGGIVAAEPIKQLREKVSLKNGTIDPKSKSQLMFDARLLKKNTVFLEKIQPVKP